MPAVGPVIVSNEGVPNIRALAHAGVVVPERHERTRREPLGIHDHPVIGDTGILIGHLVRAHGFFKRRRQGVTANFQNLLHLMDVGVAYILKVGLDRFLDLRVFRRGEVQVALPHANDFTPKALDEATYSLAERLFLPAPA